MTSGASICDQSSYVWLQKIVPQLSFRFAIDPYRSRSQPWKHATQRSQTQRPPSSLSICQATMRASEPYRSPSARTIASAAAWNAGWFGQ